MAVNRAVSSHLDRMGLTRSGVLDSAIMRHGRWYSSTMLGVSAGAWVSAGCAPVAGRRRSHCVLPRRLVWESVQDCPGVGSRRCRRVMA